MSFWEQGGGGGGGSGGGGQDLGVGTDADRVEPEVKHFLSLALARSHDIRMAYYSTVTNVALFVLFCIVTGALLMYRYHGRHDEEEQKRKQMEKEKYMLERIRNFQHMRQQSRYLSSQLGSGNGERDTQSIHFATDDIHSILGNTFPPLDRI
jgi:hypothetical protein